MYSQVYCWVGFGFVNWNENQEYLSCLLKYSIPNNTYLSQFIIQMSSELLMLV